MIIWVVRAWDFGETKPDNTIGCYMKREDAEKRCNEARDSKMYDFCECQPEEVMLSYDV